MRTSPLLCALLLAAGCDDRAGPSAGDASAPEDAFRLPFDASVAACSPDACRAPPPPACDGDRTVVHAPEGRCVETGGGFRCEHAPAPALGEDCAASGAVCHYGRCLAPVPAALPSGARFTWIDTLAVAEDRGPAACCHDYTGDGVADNRLGRALFRAAAAVDADERWVNDMMRLQIDRGRFAAIFATAADGAWLFSAAHVEPSPDPSARETPGPMRVLPGSFAGGRPVTATGEAGVADGRFAARFGEATLWLPMERLRLAVRVFDLRVDARPDGDGWADGRIAARVHVTDLFDALNAALRAGCPCLGDDPGPVFLAGPEGAGPACARPDLTACRATADQGPLDCARVVEMCPVLAHELRPEIDADRSGVPETTTLGLRFGARPVAAVTFAE
jgi:hypothetical protein